MKTNTYGMASDPFDPDRLTKPPVVDEDIRDPDTSAYDEIADLMPDDDDDEDADDDQITASDLDDSVIGDDADDGIDVSADDGDQEDTEMDNEPRMNAEPTMTHTCACGERNTILAPLGYTFKGTAKPDRETNAALGQRRKALDEAFAAVATFKESYAQGRKPRRAPFPW